MPRADPAAAPSDALAQQGFEQGASAARGPEGDEAAERRVGGVVVHARLGPHPASLGGDIAKKTETETETETVKEIPEAVADQTTSSDTDQTAPSSADRATSEEAVLEEERESAERATETTLREHESLKPMVLEPLLIDRLGWNRLSSTVVAAQLLELGKSNPSVQPDFGPRARHRRGRPGRTPSSRRRRRTAEPTWTQRARSSATRVGSGPALALSRPPTWPWIAPGI